MNLVPNKWITLTWTQYFEYFKHSLISSIFKESLIFEICDITLRFTTHGKKHLEIIANFRFLILSEFERND